MHAASRQAIGGLAADRLRPPLKMEIGLDQICSPFPISPSRTRLFLFGQALRSFRLIPAAPMIPNPKSKAVEAPSGTGALIPEAENVHSLGSALAMGSWLVKFQDMGVGV